MATNKQKQDGMYREGKWILGESGESLLRGKYDRGLGPQEKKKKD